MAGPLLRMEGIKKSFPGVQALRGVSLELEAGEALALIGANGAGKSTLMNILGGVVAADAGAIYIDGARAHIRSPKDAARYGIAFVHQEMALLPTMSVAENMYITSFPTRAGLIDRTSIEQACRQALARLDARIDPRTKVRELSPGERQMVEIARVLLGKPRLIIFDEPTSSLTSREKVQLFRVINSLKSEGVGIIYITHLLDEVFEVCDRAVVLRDGQIVGSGSIKEITRDHIVQLMVGGRPVSRYTRRGAPSTDQVVLRVEGLGRQGVLEDISFVLYRGEIVGLWGLLGSGRTELARAIVGLDPIDQGRIEVLINGSLTPVHPRSMKNWVGMISENRRDEGLLLPMSVKTNMSLANLPALLSRIWPFIDSLRETSLTREYVDRLSIKVASLDQPVETLSGGNQQKVILARWLQRRPQIYILDEPTRGLDVGAKAETRRIVAELADQGAAVLLISSDIDELMELADRYLVMRRGRIVAQYPASASKADLMAAAAGAA